MVVAMDSNEKIMKIVLYNNPNIMKKRFLGSRKCFFWWYHLFLTCPDFVSDMTKISELRAYSSVSGPVSPSACSHHALPTYYK